MLIDLHTHSFPQSDDSFAAVDDLIDNAKAAKLDGICLTDHDFFWSNDEVRDLARRHDFLVLPGSEINTDTGHVLVFGLDRYVFGMHKPGFLVNAVRERKGVMIAAHPYRRRFLEDPGHSPEARQEMLDRASSDEFFGSCDGIEGINGRGKDVQNLFSQDLAERLGIKMTGGSDAHRVEQIGSAATVFERKITGLDDLIQEIKAGRFRAETVINSQEASRSA
ncbi:MAG: PHP domain-containing protein [Chloroflexota bacterium]|nr:PHP domain-containing protein [Chloroflexota bacterium]